MHKIKSNAKEISKERELELKENAFGILSECRRQLINRAPFTGTVAMNLDIVPIRDQRVQTACTDGQSIFFDIDFLSSLSPEETNFVFSHEVFHVLMAHFLRSEGYPDREKLNIAQDLEINQMLKQEVDENGHLGLTVPVHALLPEKFGLPEGLSAEQYYELLDQKNPPQKVKMLLAGGSGNGNPLSGNFDRHLDNTDNVHQEEKKDDVADKYGKVGFDPDFNPECKPSNADKARESAIAASQICEQRMKGNLPAHLKKFINKLMSPEVNWREVLRDFVTRSIGDKANWNKPNRRFAYSGTYLPSHQGEKINLGVIIDTSGSTAGDIPKFLGELNSLVQTFGNYTLNLLQIDTEVQSCETYDDDNPLDLENTKFEVNGGGGTIMKPAFDYLKEHDELECDSLVLLTDGFTDKITSEFTDLPLLTVLCKNGTEEQVEYGEVVKLKN